LVKDLMRRTFGLIATFALLAACENTGGLRPLRGDNPYAPAGVDRGGESVDGLLVGHRLMEAGEYELALKAYLRAAGTHGMNADTLSALGSANLRLGRLGQAETLLRKAVAEDETFPPAWNNLGVVLMERNKIGEAERVFRTAFALDSGESADIRENLRLALAKLENPAYDEADNNAFALVRRGGGKFLLLSR
jgi:Flp pilus assembly protein TadD